VHSRRRVPQSRAEARQGTVRAEGDNDAGQLCDDTEDDRHLPVKVLHLVGAKHIATETDTSYAIKGGKKQRPLVVTRRADASIRPSVETCVNYVFRPTVVTAKIEVGQIGRGGLMGWNIVGGITLIAAGIGGNLVLVGAEIGGLLALVGLGLLFVGTCWFLGSTTES